MTISVKDIRLPHRRIVRARELSLDGGHPSDVLAADQPGHFILTGIP
jgi:hypothetical protein